jgi:ATP-dependent DNA ligase
MERRRTEATALPNWVKPQPTKLVDQPPEGAEWLHEIKFDGYRMHARFDHGAVRLLTRTGLDWTHKYPAIAAAVASLPATQAYLDGELCGVRRTIFKARLYFNNSTLQSTTALSCIVKHSDI